VVPTTPRAAAACLALALPLAPAAARGGEADVLGVEVACEERTCAFAVTLRHADTGWDHYADRYEIVAPDGRVLGTRVLQHPHVDEQPFTRRLPGIEIPPGVARVRVRAGDSVHGFGGAEVEVEVPVTAPVPGTEAR
jgi:hypothetical protein